MTGSRKPLKCWSITLAQNFKTLPEHTRIADILAEFFDQWMFQLEEGASPPTRIRSLQCASGRGMANEGLTV